MTALIIFLLYSSQLGIELGNSIRGTDLIVDLLTDDKVDYLRVDHLRS